MTDQDLRNKLIYKLLRNNVIGGHKKQIQTVTNWFQSSDQGKVKELIEDMATDPTAPIEKYGGGHRENIRLTGATEAVQYLDDNGGEIPFGFEDKLDEGD